MWVNPLILAVLLVVAWKLRAVQRGAAAVLQRTADVSQLHRMLTSGGGGNGLDASAHNGLPGAEKMDIAMDMEMTALTRQPVQHAAAVLAANSTGLQLSVGPNGEMGPNGDRPVIALQEQHRQANKRPVVQTDAGVLTAVSPRAGGSLGGLGSTAMVVHVGQLLAQLAMRHGDLDGGGFGDLERPWRPTGLAHSQLVRQAALRSSGKAGSPLAGLGAQQPPALARSSLGRSSVEAAWKVAGSPAGPRVTGAPRRLAPLGRSSVPVTLRYGGGGGGDGGGNHALDSDVADAHVGAEAAPGAGAVGSRAAQQNHRASREARSLARTSDHVSFRVRQPPAPISVSESESAPSGPTTPKAGPPLLLNDAPLRPAPAGDAVAVPPASMAAGQAAGLQCSALAPPSQHLVGTGLAAEPSLSGPIPSVELVAGFEETASGSGGGGAPAPGHHLHSSGTAAAGRHSGRSTTLSNGGVARAASRVLSTVFSFSRMRPPTATSADISIPNTNAPNAGNATTAGEAECSPLQPDPASGSVHNQGDPHTVVITMAEEQPQQSHAPHASASGSVGGTTAAVAPSALPDQASRTAGQVSEAMPVSTAERPDQAVQLRSGKIGDATQALQPRPSNSTLASTSAAWQLLWQGGEEGPGALKGGIKASRGGAGDFVPQATGLQAAAESAAAAADLQRDLHRCAA